MLILSIIFILLSNALNLREDLSILYNRIVILCLFYCVINNFSSLILTLQPVGLHGGLLVISNNAQIFQIFIYIIAGIILILTSFYPRKV